MKANLRFLVAFSILLVLGLGTTGYILIKQRAPVPFKDGYEVVVEFSAGDGLLARSGQPVNVVGVEVGKVTGVEVGTGVARATLTIRRGELPRIHRDATAFIDPITPLEDLQIELDPGSASAPALPSGGVIRVAQTDSPYPVHDLLAKLDTDTRTYLSTVFANLRQGTDGRGVDLRRMLVALGPTTEQAGHITRALAERRRALSGFVTNLARVTEAASQDRRLATLVSAGNATLGAMAQQEGPLREAIAKLPGSLEATRSTLLQAKPFADRLGPTLDRLGPAVSGLPATLRSLRPLADVGTEVIGSDLRPFLREATPVLRDLDPSVRTVFEIAPQLTRGLMAANYVFNEFAFNPEGDDEGGLFWLSWFIHNWNDLFSTVDAHGGIGRATVLMSCNEYVNAKPLQPLLDTVGVCPNGAN